MGGWVSRLTWHLPPWRCAHERRSRHGHGQQQLHRGNGLIHFQQQPQVPAPQVIWLIAPAALAHRQQQPNQTCCLHRCVGSLPAANLLYIPHMLPPRRCIVFGTPRLGNAAFSQAFGWLVGLCYRWVLLQVGLAAGGFGCYKSVLLQVGLAAWVWHPYFLYSPVCLMEPTPTQLPASPNACPIPTHTSPCRGQCFLLSSAPPAGVCIGWTP